MFHRPMCIDISNFTGGLAAYCRCPAGPRPHHARLTCRCRVLTVVVIKNRIAGLVDLAVLRATLFRKSRETCSSRSVPCFNNGLLTRQKRFTRRCSKGRTAHALRCILQICHQKHPRALEHQQVPSQPRNHNTHTISAGGVEAGCHDQKNTPVSWPI